MPRIDNMVSQLSREVERLGCDVLDSTVADKRHAVIVTADPPKDCAVRLSRSLPGSIFFGGSHISWVHSNFAVAVHTVETFAKLAPVRAATEWITGEPGRYGIGACARQLVAWLGPADTGGPKLRKYVGDWHYQRCAPCTMDDAYQFDLSACYFNLLKRVPTLSPVFTDDEVFWRSTPDSVTARFARLIRGVEAVKPLRNAMIGAMYGGSLHEFLSAGESRKFTAAPGARATLAAVIVRTAYEVCQLQAELVDACYANTDSVISAHDAPGFWRDLGLPYTLSARGPAIVQAIGKYQVGVKATKTFQADTSRKIKAARESRRVDPIYWAWLTREVPLLA